MRGEGWPPDFDLPEFDDERGWGPSRLASLCIVALIIIGNLILATALSDSGELGEGLPRDIWFSANWVAAGGCFALFVLEVVRLYFAARGRRTADQEGDADRRRRNKLVNERLKLIAGFLNTIGASTFLAITVVPMLLSQTAHSTNLAVEGLGIAVVCHLGGQVILSLWRSEE